MSKYLKARDIMEILQISADTLDRWIAKDKFPPPDLQVSRVRMWDSDNFKRWLELNKPKQSAVA